jgi:uncharacterized protein (TIGR02453 family)
MGGYIASHGGRKSPRGGYYFHLEPGSCFASAGVWCPEPPVLKTLREAVYENIEEFKDIIEEKGFKQYFGNSFHDGDMLKTAPKGFPKDFEDLYYLKLKHYIANRDLPATFFEQEDFMPKIIEMFKSAYPLNKFLNFTIDETLNF